MNVSIKSLALGSMLTIATGAALIFCSNHKNDLNNKRQFQKELNAKQANDTNFQNNDTKLDSIDLTKPNLPKIVNNNFIYKTLDGKTQRVKMDVFSINPFYKALANSINKYSTIDSPEIKNSDDFFVEMYSQLPKIAPTSYGDIKAIKVNTSISNYTNTFNKLYDIYTAPDSEAGKTITVREYTQMMKAYVGISK